MSSKRSVAVVALSSVLTVGSPFVARAQQLTTLPTTIRSVPTALTSCRITFSSLYPTDSVGFVIANRTRHQLISATAYVIAYDADNVRVAQVTQPLQLPDAIAPGDTEVVNLGIGFNVDQKLVSRAVCRLSEAVFTGDKRWKYPQHWHEPLVSLSGQ